MDGQSIEHSDSDSGESWTLLENNSVYADEPPEFIEELEKHGAQQHEKDEDTDGISIISDSDHDAPTPPPGAAVYEKYQSQEENHLSEDISDFVSVKADEPKINHDNDDQDPLKDDDFLEDSHVRHKTYVHKRNKRLSTVLNIIVLGSVITAAGVAIGHMWGAKNDCTMQSTSSVNKILSNLYKLQEENAYLRGKLKELTFGNNHHTQQQKQALKHNKCRKVFEESLSNNEHKRYTKCVDDNANNDDSLVEHLTKPKFEKEFIADMDKLKSVYLQNKSWLDDEISRRIKIEEELLKKYNDEVNSSNEQKKPTFHKNSKPILSDAKLNRDRKNNLDLGNFEHKVSYADSLKTDFKPRFRRNEERYETDEDNEWLTSKQHVSSFDQDIPQESVSNDQSKTDQKVEPQVNYESGYTSDSAKNINNDKEQSVTADNWAEDKPKTRRNEERYEDDNWSKYAKEAKNKRKNEKRDVKKNYKQITKAKGDFDEKIPDYTNSEEDFRKDDRYVTNKLNKEKKRNRNVNSNKKDKRKNKLQKWNMKGEFGEQIEAESIPEDIALNYPNKIQNFDQVTFIDKLDDSENTVEKESTKDDKSGGQYEYKEQPANWFEKRAVFRTEARKKYLEQYGGTSLNNSSWYFRRMRKREQCRAKGDNSTFKKNRKEKNYYKMKQ